MDTAGFQFDGRLVREGRNVNVPSGIESKRELLEILGNSLSFPGYYGVNWDAFLDCIRDLSWLSEDVVVINHKDLPLEQKPELARTYLYVLRVAVEKWSDSGERELIIVFPAHLKPRITSVPTIIRIKSTG